MEANNPLYKNQGMHVVSSIFTVEKGVAKVLLVKRKNEPFKGSWALVSGGLYNNETINDGMQREIKEKTGIDSVKIYFSKLFDDLDRSPLMRMFAVSFIGLLDYKKVSILKETTKTSDYKWFSIDDIPELAYDHNKILKESLETLKVKILSSDILSTLFPNGFTIPEIRKTYESILEKEFDRRNFRKKLLSLDLIEDTNEYATFEGKKPAKLYVFKEKINNKSVF
jgi:8-oxo-dGTP diphosphatase